MAFLSLPFIYYHGAFVLNSNKHARDTQIHAERLKQKAQLTAEYYEKNGRYPDKCWLNDCDGAEVWMVFWTIEKESSDGFIVQYRAPGAMFGSVGSLGHRVYWLNTETGEFSHSHVDSFIEVAARYTFHLLLTLIPIILLIASEFAPKTKAEETIKKNTP